MLYTILKKLINFIILFLCIIWKYIKYIYIINLNPNYNIFIKSPVFHPDQSLSLSVYKREKTQTYKIRFLPFNKIYIAPNIITAQKIENEIKNYYVNDIRPTNAIVALTYCNFRIHDPKKNINFTKSEKLIDSGIIDDVSNLNNIKIKILACWNSWSEFYNPLNITQITLTFIKIKKW